MPQIVLGLGSNIGDSAATLQRAISALAETVQDLRVSRVWRSPALLPPEAPPEWNIPFLNMAVAGQTQLAPRALLEYVQDLEKQLGRVKQGFWSPRTIDIDILAYGEETIDMQDLQIPHRELFNRDFALIPLAEVVPDWPCRETTASALARKLFPEPALQETNIEIKP